MPDFMDLLSLKESLQLHNVLLKQKESKYKFTLMRKKRLNDNNSSDVFSYLSDYNSFFNNKKLKARL